MIIKFAGKIFILLVILKLSFSFLIINLLILNEIKRNRIRLQLKYYQHYQRIVFSIVSEPGS